MPRQVLPGSFYKITRRCTQRQFLLRPDEVTNNVFAYCLGEAAARFDIDVMMTTAESNHHHTDIFDRHGNVIAFVLRGGPNDGHQGGVSDGHRERGEGAAGRRWASSAWRA